MALWHSTLRCNYRRRHDLSPDHCFWYHPKCYVSIGNIRRRYHNVVRPTRSMLHRFHVPFRIGRQGAYIWMLAIVADILTTGSLIWDCRIALCPLSRKPFEIPSFCRQFFVQFWFRVVSRCQTSLSKCSSLEFWTSSTTWCTRMDLWPADFIHLLVVRIEQRWLHRINVMKYFNFKRNHRENEWFGTKNIRRHIRSFYCNELCLSVGCFAYFNFRRLQLAVNSIEIISSKWTKKTTPFTRRMANMTFSNGSIMRLVQIPWVTVPDYVRWWFQF